VRVEIYTQGSQELGKSRKGLQKMPERYSRQEVLPEIGKEGQPISASRRMLLREQIDERCDDRRTGYQD
jgi:hypothetical protein